MRIYACVNISALNVFISFILTVVCCYFILSEKSLIFEQYFYITCFLPKMYNQSCVKWQKKIYSNIFRRRLCHKVSLRLLYIIHPKSILFSQIYILSFYLDEKKRKVCYRHFNMLIYRDKIFRHL